MSGAGGGAKWSIRSAIISAFQRFHNSPIKRSRTAVVREKHHNNNQVVERAGIKNRQAIRRLAAMRATRTVVISRHFVGAQGHIGKGRCDE